MTKRNWKHFLRSRKASLRMWHSVWNQKKKLVPQKQHGAASAKSWGGKGSERRQIRQRVLSEGERIKQSRIRWETEAQNSVARQAFPHGSAVKNPPAVQEPKEMQVRSLGWEDPLEGGMAAPSSILAWRISWTEEPGRLQSIGSQRVRHDWRDLACTRVACK